MTTRLVILSGLLLCGSLASGKNELSFKETVVPVKVAPDQDSITASFPFTNTSGTPVTISKIHVSCDCTTAGAKDNKLTYAPGESGVISAVMKTGNFSGTVDKDMTVHANGSAYKLVIRAQIPDIIRMEPRKLEWARGEAAVPKTIKITISKELPVNLTTVDLTGDAFDYEPVTVKKGREYKIIVTPKSTARPAFNTLGAHGFRRAALQAPNGVPGHQGKLISALPSMRDAFSTALKLLLAVFLLAVGVAALDLRVIQPFRTPPCNPETLEEGHVCLSQVLKEWPGKILWIDARKQDDFERHTVTQAPVYPIRPADANYQELLANAMEALMTAEDKGFCIVIFCSRDCTSSAAVANELKKPEYGIRAPIFILEGGWDELRKEPSLVP